MKEQDSVGSFRKLAGLWDGVKVDELFGQSKEDLIFRKVTGSDELIFKGKISSMTTLLMYTVAHSTKPSFMPKTNNQPPEKFLSLAFS